MINLAALAFLARLLWNFFFFNKVHIFWNCSSSVECLAFSLFFNILIQGVLQQIARLKLVIDNSNIVLKSEWFNEAENLLFPQGRTPVCS